MLAGQVTVGFSLSLTVTVKEQLAVLPEASVAVQLTVVVPFGKLEPDGGVHTTPTPGQLSVALAVKLTFAAHCPGAVLVLIFAGQVTVGGVWSTTLTLNWQVSLFPAASVAMQVTRVVPAGKVEPEGGVQAIEAPAQLSVTLAV
jgi:hypothetical protein